MMKKNISFNSLVIMILITFLSMFLATMPVYAAGNIDEFYYKGTTGATYSERDSLLSRIVKAIPEIADYVIGVALMGIRIVFVGWAALLEWILVATIDAVTGTNIQEKDDDSDIWSIMQSTENRVTIEKIIFNEIPLFNANIFKFDFEEAK